jgi:hypothetical protein
LDGYRMPKVSALLGRRLPHPAYSAIGWHGARPDMH